MAASLFHSLSFSSSLLPSPQSNSNSKSSSTTIFNHNHSSSSPSTISISRAFRCAFASPVKRRSNYNSSSSSSSSPSSSAPRKKHWKQGEFPVSSDSREKKPWKQGEFSDSREKKHWKKQGEFSGGSDSREKKHWKKEGEYFESRKKVWRQGGEFSGDSESRKKVWKQGGEFSESRKKVWKQGEFPGSSESGMSKKTPIKNMKKKLDRKNDAKAWVNTVTETLSDHIQNKQWLLALEVFDMLREQPFYQPKEGTYMKLLVLLGRSGQPQRAHQLFHQMVEEGLEPTSELYTALLGAYCRSNLIEEAFSILNEMKTLPRCQPDVFTYSTLIKVCVDDSRFELVESIYEEMDQRVLTPNTVTQNIVLSGYGKAGKYDQMEKVLLGMLESTTCKPDVWTMNTILSLFGNKGQIEMMEKWYEKFRNFGIEPETRSFNILIGAYGKKRMYDKMSTVMEYMRKLQFPWTTSTYNNVIEAFSDVGDAKNMEYTFDQMRAEGMKADTKTFCCLIRGYANAGLFHKVINTVQLAGKFEIPENTSFHNAVISACAKANDLLEMERVFNRMKDKLCQPDSTTYSIMVEAYTKEGMTDKVFDLEQEIQMVHANASEGASVGD